MRSSGSEPVESVWSITPWILEVPDVIRGGILLNGVRIGQLGALFDLATSFAGICLLPWASFYPGSQFPRPIPGSRDASSSFPDRRPVSFPLSHRSLRGFRWMRLGVFFGCGSVGQVSGLDVSCLVRLFSLCQSATCLRRILLDCDESSVCAVGEHFSWHFSRWTWLG